jgi:hypothetical protein
MTKFYSHLIEYESLIIELDQLELSEKEKHDLATLADSNLHHTILDNIFSELGEEDKHKFLDHINEENHDKIWALLNEKVERIEEKIKKAAHELKEEMKADIRQAKEKRIQNEK